MDNCNAEKGKNQVFDPFVNTGVAVMLDSERKKICGVIGTTEGCNCPLPLGDLGCDYQIGGAVPGDMPRCTLKLVSKTMRRNDAAPDNGPHPKGGNA